MPTYIFKNTKTEELVEQQMKISEMEMFLEDNPDWIVDITQGFPGLHSGVGLGVRRPDDGFRDLLKSMKKTHDRRGGKIDVH